MSAAAALLRDSRLLVRAVGYEFRRASVFRVGFLVREVLRDLVQPAVMIFVYHALFARDGVGALRGWSYPELVSYLLLVAVFSKLLFHNRGLDLAEQIFEGYLTKYMVLPAGYGALALGRFVQYVALQVVVGATLFALGSLLAPAWWPRPVSAVALVQALALTLCGSLCYFLAYFVVNLLAFWLEVVWTLLVMVSFLFTFAAGVLLPVSIMPPFVRAALEWSFPYWSLSAPIEIFLGRLPPEAFWRGMGVLLVSALALEALRRFLWSRGRRSYAGGGM